MGIVMLAVFAAWCVGGVVYGCIVGYKNITETK